MQDISFIISKTPETTELEKGYDLIILGGGPAGLTAAIYAARAQIKTLLIEKEAIGGEAASTDLIENYPGFPEGVSGFELVDNMRQQAEWFGTQIYYATPAKLDLKSQPKTITLEEKTLNAKTIIIAAGDIRETEIRQVATAIGDGTLAANSAQLFLEKYLGDQQ